MTDQSPAATLWYKSTDRASPGPLAQRAAAEPSSRQLNLANCLAGSLKAAASHIIAARFSCTPQAQLKLLHTDCATLDAKALRIASPGPLAPHAAAEPSSWQARPWTSAWPGRSCHCALGSRCQKLWPACEPCLHALPHAAAACTAKICERRAHHSLGPASIRTCVRVRWQSNISSETTKRPHSQKCKLAR